MFRSNPSATVVSLALLFGALLGSASHLTLAHADMSHEAAQAKSEARPPHDPKKKNDGESCKQSSECQPHSSCVKVGDKSVCQAPPRPQLPPGAVT